MDMECLDCARIAKGRRHLSRCWIKTFNQSLANASHLKEVASIIGENWKGLNLHSVNDISIGR